MAEPIFEIAQRFQNKIEGDLGYANRQKEAFRDQYRADKKLPSELSGYTLEDMSNQFGIAEHKQNDATNLAASGAQADLGLMTANDNKSAFAGEANLREQERAKKLAEFSRIAEIDSLTLDSQIKKLQSDAALEPDRAKKEKLDLEAEILKTEIAIRQAPTEAVVQELKLKRQAMEEQYALSNAPAEQAVTAEQAKADLATAKTNVIAAEANLASAPDEVARAEAQRQLDKAKLDYANKTLGEEQALADQTRKNETATAKFAETVAAEQRVIDSMKRKQEIESLESQLAIAPTLDKIIELNAQLELKEKEHALQENQALEETRQKMKKEIDTDRRQKILNEHMTTQIQTATNTNSIIDLTAQTTFNDLKAAIPEYDLMPKGPRYMALYDAADAQHVSPEALKKINADLAKNIPKELEYVSVFTETMALSTKPRTPTNAAALTAAAAKLASLEGKMDVDLLKLAIDKGVIPEDGLPTGFMDVVGTIGSPNRSSSPASSIDTTSPNPNETFDAAAGPSAFAPQDTVMSEPAGGPEAVPQDESIPNPPDSDIALVPPSMRELMVKQPKNGNNEEIVAEIMQALQSPEVSNDNVAAIEAAKRRIEALRGQ